MKVLMKGILTDLDLFDKRGPVVFDITGSGTVKGLFLVGGVANAQSKGDHTSGGTLWATALFGTGDVPVNAEDQLKVTYTVSA